MNEPMPVKEEWLSEKDYLAKERKGPREAHQTYEYRNGKLHFMGGTNKEHNYISTNLILLLGNLFFNTDYQIFSAEMRTYMSHANSYFYPDLIVVKGEP